MTVSQAAAINIRVPNQVLNAPYGKEKDFFIMQKPLANIWKNNEIVSISDNFILYSIVHSTA